MRQPDRVFRNKFVQAIAAVGIALFLGIGLAIALDPKAPAYLGGIVGTVGAYLAWMVGWQSAVRLRPDGVEVDNMFMSGFVPWGLFREFRIANGLKIVMTNGRVINSFAFGGSVAGQLTGNRRMRHVVERMEADRDNLTAGQAPPNGSAGVYRQGIRIAIWPLLAFVVPLEIIGVLASVLKK